MAGQLFLVLELQCPVQTPAEAQSAHDPLRRTRTHTATNATATNASTIMSAKESTAFTSYDTIIVPHAAKTHRVYVFFSTRSRVHRGWNLLDNRGDGRRRQSRSELKAGTCWAPGEQPNLIWARAPSYAAAAAGATPSSSPIAPLGMGRKSWKRMSAMNAKATTVHSPNSPSTMRL